MVAAAAESPIRQGVLPFRFTGIPVLVPWDVGAHLLQDYDSESPDPDDPESLATVTRYMTALCSRYADAGHRCSSQATHTSGTPTGPRNGKVYRLRPLIRSKLRILDRRRRTRRYRRRKLHFSGAIQVHASGDPRRTRWRGKSISVGRGNVLTKLKLSSCFLLTASQTSFEPGIRNCDSTVEGFHVFWREIFDPKLCTESALGADAARTASLKAVIAATDGDMQVNA